jgi:lysophospholipase L1-like esterase
LDDLRLEASLPVDTKEYRPAGDPLARVRAKLKARQPITVVTMGDSLTDFHHWTNRQVAWPRLLAKQLEEKYGSRVTIDNPAIGGTQLRQNLVLLPRWLARVPEPDLVTICFGGNDWDAGMRGPEFEASLQDAVDRVRRATHGKADVLLMTTVPAIARWTAATELAGAARKAARDRNAGLADTEQAFLAQEPNREQLFATDKVHMGTPGHELLAKTVLAAIEGSGK